MASGVAMPVEIETVLPSAGSLTLGLHTAALTVARSPPKVEGGGAPFQVILLLPAEVVGVAAIPTILFVFGVTHREQQTRRSQLAFRGSHQLIASGEDDLRQPEAPVVVWIDKHAVRRIDPAIGVGRAMGTLAEIEGVATGTGAHGVVIVAEGTAHGVSRRCSRNAP